MSIDPVTINILILSDGRLNAMDTDSIPDPDFGLSRLVSILSEKQGRYVQFNVIRKLLVDYPAGLKSILKKDLYQEVWLFGDLCPKGSKSNQPGERVAKGELDRDELEALSDFMKVGGAFATGDHKDLGGAMNGKTVRIRKMRKWFFDPCPLGELKAPPRNGVERHDTLRKGHFNGYVSWDQEDDVPQIIVPTQFATSYGSAQAHYAHPLLSSATGVINVLPDHMHEGECYVSLDLADDEFPSPNGVRPLPIVIAKSKIPESHPTMDYPNGVADSSFNVTDSRGLICAYDGHPVSVGRVVVDSTFHHFLNLNQRDFAKSSNAIDPERGSLAYEQIKNYYRNIALWLAPAEHQQRVFARVLWDTASVLKVQFSGGTPGLADLIYLGAAARLVAGRSLSSSFLLQWSFELIYEIAGPAVSASLVDPWLTRTGAILPPGLIDTETALNAVVGGAILSLAHLGVDADETKIRKAVRNGAATAFDCFLQACGDTARSVGSDFTNSAPTRTEFGIETKSGGRIPYLDSSRLSAGSNAELISPKGDTMIWYAVDWWLYLSTGEVWTIVIFVQDGKLWVKLAPCGVRPEDNPPPCPFCAPSLVCGPSSATSGDVSVSFCTKLGDHTYCFMIDFYDRGSPSISTLHYRYLKLGYPAAADGSNGDLVVLGEGSGTGTRPPVTLLNPAAIDDGSGTVTRPPGTVQP